MTGSTSTTDACKKCNRRYDDTPVENPTDQCEDCLEPYVKQEVQKPSKQEDVDDATDTNTNSSASEDSGNESDNEWECVCKVCMDAWEDAGVEPGFRCAETRELKVRGENEVKLIRKPRNRAEFTVRFEFDPLDLTGLVKPVIKIFHRTVANPQDRWVTITLSPTGTVSLPPTSNWDFGRDYVTSLVIITPVVGTIHFTWVLACPYAIRANHECDYGEVEIVRDVTLESVYDEAMECMIFVTDKFDCESDINRTTYHQLRDASQFESMLFDQHHCPFWGCPHGYFVTKQRQHATKVEIVRECCPRAENFISYFRPPPGQRKRSYATLSREDAAKEEERLTKKSRVDKQLDRSLMILQQQDAPPPGVLVGAGDPNEQFDDVYYVSGRTWTDEEMQGTDWRNHKLAKPSVAKRAFHFRHKSAYAGPDMPGPSEIQDIRRLRHASLQWDREKTLLLKQVAELRANQGQPPHYVEVEEID